jgi:site-specific recombinase XerC
LNQQKEPTDERDHSHRCDQPIASADDRRHERAPVSYETQRNYVRDVGRFATFLRRSPDMATADDVRRFQVEQRDAGVPAPTMNSIVSALRFFFTHTIDRPDLARKLIGVAHPRNLPAVLSRDEVTRLLNATTCLKHRAALSVACGGVDASSSMRARAAHVLEARRARRSPKEGTEALDGADVAFPG